MVLFWGDRRTLLARDESLEHPDGRTVNIAGNERHPNPLILGHGLQMADESVPFPLWVWFSDLTNRGQSHRDTL